MSRPPLIYAPAFIGRLKMCWLDIKQGNLRTLIFDVVRLPWRDLLRAWNWKHWRAKP